MRNSITESLFKKYVGVTESEFSRELYMDIEKFDNWLLMVCTSAVMDLCIIGWIKFQLKNKGKM